MVEEPLVQMLCPFRIPCVSNVGNQCPRTTGRSNCTSKARKRSKSGDFR